MNRNYISTGRLRKERFPQKEKLKGREEELCKDPLPPHLVNNVFNQLSSSRGESGRTPDDEEQNQHLPQRPILYHKYPDEVVHPKSAPDRELTADIQNDSHGRCTGNNQRCTPNAEHGEIKPPNAGKPKRFI
ncbi:hypothetical protein RR48_15431 [Papilio machaon]|uniref:Uncharacterized protein n=1 Tax=Papilio machaon TaxID=76193 RepID=A0A194QWF0_PAPMA|nr:hypothetical protein RR48_15431 [Papilio machaon]